MIKHNRIFAILLAFFVAISVVPTTLFAEADLNLSIALSGNKGAVITANKNITASTGDTNLITVSTDGNSAVVTAKSGVEGIANVIITDGSTTKKVQIPVGYTTFEFNGDTLTVYEGSDDKYEISGINTKDEEYLVGDANYDLPVTTDEDGNQVYENSDSYKINVGIKKKGGNYVFTGKSTDMTITVKKEATNTAYLYFAGLDLSSSFTAPLTIKKDSTSNVVLNVLGGFENNLSDNDFNNADKYGDPTEDGGNGTNTAYAESAVIKGKTAANLTIEGSGTLNINCKSKNGIKVGTSGSLTIKNVTLNVYSTDNGISSDNTMNIESGAIYVQSTSDAIRSNPDTVDAANGLAGNINISGGRISLVAGSDGIQASQDITISGGTFNIKTGAGYNDRSFNGNTMSCKGIKASNNTDDSSDTSTATNKITISGGTFNMNTADDAIHSDNDLVITGGKFVIFTGDDGIHSDTTMTIGEQNASNDLINIRIESSYEGIESGNLYFYSGNYRILSSDDGINAAGGSDASDNPGGGFNPWNPGGPGGGHGGPGGPGGPGGGGGNYSINIYGGKFFVNTSSDGLDSNGGISVVGGEVLVWGNQSGGDGEPLDCDGSLVIKGGTVFGAGSRQMVTTPTNSQTYKTYTQSITTGRTINVKNGSTTVFNTKALKSANYVIYSSPSMTSSWTITVDSSALINDETVETVTPVQPSPNDPVDTPSTFEVTFIDGVTGEILRISNVKANTIITNFPTPEEHRGYVFNKWNYDGMPVTESITITALYYALGDADMNSILNTYDASVVLMYVAKLNEMTEEQLKVADITENGNVDADDATMILRTLAEF